MQHTLSQFLAEKGFLFSPSFDGQYQRDGSKWYRGVEVLVKDHTVYVARFGDWKTGERHEWVSEKPETPEDAAHLKAALDAFQKEEDAERAGVQAAVALQASQYFEAAIDRGTTPYLQRKQIPKLLGARI